MAQIACLWPRQHSVRPRQHPVAQTAFCAAQTAFCVAQTNWVPVFSVRERVTPPAFARSDGRGLNFWSLDRHFEVQGWRCGALWGSWGALWGPFWVLGVALDVPSGGQGVPLGAFGAQGVSKTASLDQWRTILTDFGAERVPKWLPKLTKNHLKSIKHL